VTAKHWRLLVVCSVRITHDHQVLKPPVPEGKVMRMARLPIRWATLICLAFCGERVAFADDVTGLEGMLNEAVVSSASKQSEGASSAPALSMSLTAEDLRRYGLRTLGEALDFLSIAVSTSDNLNGGEVGARGVLITGDRGSHFLLLVDGNIQNDPFRGGATFGQGAAIPIELIDHIEVIVGPGSVLYGSNAMFGLVNVITKRAKDYSGGHFIVESALPTSMRLGGGMGTTFSLFGKTGEATTQIEYYKQNGPAFFFDAENTGVDRFTGQPGRNTRDGGPTGIWGGGRASNSLFAEAPSGLVRVSLGDTELSLQGSYYRHSAPTSPGNFDDPDSGEKETRGIVGLKHHIAVSTLLDLSIRGYGSYYKTQSDFVTSRGVLCPFGLITCDYINNGSANWIGVETQSSWDWFRDGHFVSILGVDVRRRAVNSSNDTVNIVTGTTVFPNAQGLNRSDIVVAAYAQQTWAASSTIKLNGGARVDSDPRFSPVMTPRIAANWNPWKNGTLKVAYASAFRAPSVDETDNATARRIQADHLMPEKVQSVDLSLQHHFGAHQLVIGGFYSRWNNLVELIHLTDQETIAAIRNGKTAAPFTPGIELTQYRNASDFNNYGMNMGLEGSFSSGLFLYGFTLTGATVRKLAVTGSSRLPVAPQLFGNARVAVVTGDKLPTVGLGAHLLGPRPANVSDGQFIPTPYAPSQLELRLTLTGDAPWVKGLSYRAMVNYAVANRGPYVVGPVTSAIPSQTTPQLIPVDRFRSTVGFQYDF